MNLFLLRLMLTGIAVVIAPFMAVYSFFRKMHLILKTVWTIPYEGYVKIVKGEANFTDYE
jgi:hypothetical protein